ncbi:restriction endonuclease subunit S [Rahnella perminowiae]|uniref:restriction endonuclease subunit S n=1 Tax=Rahnella perminowiae TaxID=2816244 RepID=UPI001C27B7BA|nr:restriction endonuclease subunit S [Rahnella perminowiae]MBU9825115.1 restriction endonuclease subunit S [Rahnella perminowiae]
MAKYKAYPEYKDSGVEWLGVIPLDWELSKLRYKFAFGKGLTITKENLRDEGIPCVNYGEVHSKYGFEVDPQVHSLKCVDEKYLKENANSLLLKGDIVFADTSEDLDGSGNFTQLISDARVFAGYHTIISRPLKRDNARFYAYLLDCQELRTQVRTAVKGVKVFSVTQAILRNLSIWLPSEYEQQSIAAFLDHETAKIDNLIEKQQQLIELLKEKRQAVISHAVTKGLNPDVPMKDSGVEWLGEVPAHWSVKRLKHISPKVGVGLVINPSTYTRDEGVYFIFGGDVKEYGFDLSKTRRISPKDSNNLLPSRLNDQDLVSVRVGYPGITAVVTKDLEGSNCASIIIIRKGMFNSEWLCAAMNIWVGRQQVDLVAYGAAQKQFNVADAVEFIFPVPPYDEQVKIAHFVKNALDKFDALSSKAQAQITLLQERRTALISAAVTGKIDVRDWVAPDTSHIEESEEATA